MASAPSAPRVLCILGPTASGKSTLAQYLAERLPIDLVSVDSALVYRGLDIGTAKPDFPHRLVDIVDPAARYSAARFRDDALREIDSILAAGRTPLLVGGTMLYFRALFRGLSQLPPADPALRAEIDARAQRDGWTALHAELAAVDPAAAARIHPNDPQRIQRALEVWRLTGQPISALQQGGAAPAHDYRKLALAPADRAALQRRIEQRFAAMLDAGLLAEVARLHARGDLDPALPSLRAVGYRQLWEHLEGRVDLDQAARSAVHATRQLAKRQLTWLRREPGLSWLDPTAPGWLEQGLAWARREQGW